jgi:cell division protein FtsA
MATKRIITGIDIGSHTVRVIIAEYTPGEGLPKVIGLGKAESRGLRHGYIMNVSDAVRSIRAAVDDAEAQAGLRIRGAYLALGGVGLEGITTTGAAVVTRADSEVTDADVLRAHRAAEQNLPQAANKKILLTVPIEYRIDGKKIFARPAGMKGLKLEVNALIVTCLEQHLNDLIRVVEEAGLEVEDVQAAPIAASFVALTKSQKMAGCILANIGAETLSIVVYEDGLPISLEIFPIGSTDITNDIALGLRIPLEEAEMVKLGKDKHSYPKKKLTDIVSARLDDMFALVIAHLKKIGKHELLPAGIVLTGGGSGIQTIEDFARASMRLPARIPNTSQALLLADGSSGITEGDTSWFVAYGLCIMGASNKDSGTLGNSNNRKNMGALWETLKNAFKQFLP